MSSGFPSSGGGLLAIDGVTHIICLLVQNLKLTFEAGIQIGDILHHVVKGELISLVCIVDSWLNLLIDHHNHLVNGCLDPGGHTHFDRLLHLSPLSFEHDQPLLAVHANQRGFWHDGIALIKRGCGECASNKAQEEKSRSEHDPKLLPPPC